MGLFISARNTRTEVPARVEFEQFAKQHAQYMEETAEISIATQLGAAWQEWQK